MRRERIILFCILVVGLLVRIIKFPDSPIVMDSVVYSRLGENLIEGSRYVFGENYNMGVFFPPGYPLFIGIFNLIFNDLLFSAKFVSLISGVITIPVAYLIGKEFYDKETGLFACFVCAVYPLMILVSTDAYSDSLFFLFLFLTIYIFIVSLRKNNFVISVLFGVSVALSYLTRSEGVFLLLLPLLRLSGSFNKELRLDKRYIRHLFIIFISFFLLSLPYLLFLKSYTGKFTISGKSNISILLGELSGDHEYHKIVNAPDNLYDRAAFTLNEDKTELRGWNKKENFSLREYLLKDPVNLIGRYIKNLLQEVRISIKLLFPIIIPLFLSFLDRGFFRNRASIILIIFSLVFLLLYPFFIIIEKQTLLAILFLIFPASHGYRNSQLAIVDIVKYYGIEKNWISEFITKNIKLIIIAVLIMSSFIYIRYSRFQHFDPAHAKPEEHRWAGYFIKEKLNPAYEELNIMSKEPYVSFYSDSRFTMLPYAPLEDVIQFARLYKVDYVVVDERSLSMWDYYNDLLDMDRLRDDVELFYEDISDKQIRVFRIKNK